LFKIQRENVNEINNNDLEKVIS